MSFLESDLGGGVSPFGNVSGSFDDGLDWPELGLLLSSPGASAVVTAAVAGSPAAGGATPPAPASEPPVCVPAQPAASPPAVSTMTVLFSLSVRKVPLAQLARNFRGCIMFDPLGIALNTVRAGRRKKTFSNCVNICVRGLSGRTVTASVFSNGLLKFTGCKSEQEAVAAADVVVAKTSRALGKPIAFDASSMRVCLTKCDADLRFPVHLSHASVSLGQLMGGHALNTELYCGLKLRQKVDGSSNGVSVIVFASGKVQVSASGPPALVDAAWAEFITHVSACYPTMLRCKAAAGTSAAQIMAAAPRAPFHAAPPAVGAA